MKTKNEGTARLEAWLEANHISLARLCADIEVHPLTPYQWRRGQRPTLAAAVKIERYTSGAVPCVSWMTEVSS